MKNQLLLWSLLAFTLFSCDKDEEIPVTYFDGAYENVRETPPDTPIHARVMTFTKSGNLLIEEFVTPVGAGERCLTSYSEGTYSLRGEEFTVTLTSSFGADPSIVFSLGCIPKEELVSILNSNNKLEEGSLVFNNNKESFLLGYPCNDTFGPMSNCIGPQTYTKVS